MVGCGGMGRETMDLLDLCSTGGGSWRPLGFVDDAALTLPQEVNGFPVLGTTAWLGERRVGVAVSIGSPARRASVVRRLRNLGCTSFPTLLHPTASVGRHVVIGDGCLVMANAVLTTNVALGDFVIVNAGTTVSHDSVAADFVTLAPGAHLAGATVAETGVDFGIGAVTIPGVSLGQWCVVGAGSVVTRAVARNTVVVGVPARPVRTMADYGPGVSPCADDAPALPQSEKI